MTTACPCAKAEAPIALEVEVEVALEVEDPPAVVEEDAEDRSASTRVRAGTLPWRLA
jgi:hypothetical protein